MESALGFVAVIRIRNDYAGYFNCHTIIHVYMYKLQVKFIRLMYTVVLTH